MTKPAVTLRNTKGSALNYTELDANFTNLRDSTINFTDGTNTLSMDLNDIINIEGEPTHNISVTVNEAGNIIAIDNELSNYTLEPTGFENRTDSEFSFNAGNRTFTIQPVSGSYRFWIRGMMYARSTSDSKQIPNTSGLYYFYFDVNGELQYTTTPDFRDCLISAVQWNALDNNYYFLGEERHGITMDWATHEYLNATRGFQYASGLQATNYTTAGTGSLDSDAYIDIGNGVLYQEDIKITITHSNTPDHSLFEQDLQGPGQFPVMYHNGSTGQWTKNSPTDFPVKQGTARIAYNLNTAGTWTTPDASNNAYVAVWLVATANTIDGPIMAVLGQREDTNISNAQENNTWGSLDLTNFPGNESRPLYRLIFKTGTGYANTPKCYLADIVDYRTVDVRGSETGGGSGAVGLTAIVQDTTPQLGGDLDVNGFSIVSATNGNIPITPNGSGKIVLDGLSWPTADGTADQVLKTDGAGNLSFTTINTISSGTTNELAYYTSSGTVGSTTGIRYNTVDDNLEGSTTGQRLLLRSYGNTVASYLDLNVSDATLKATNFNILSNTNKFGATSGANVTLTTNGTGDLILNTNNGTNSGTITIYDGANSNVQISPNGSGKVNITRPVAIPVSHGTQALENIQTNSYANAATVDFANFSGMIVVNRQDSSGNVALWILGSGGVLKLGDSSGTAVSGTFSHVSGINGYRWTNDTGGTITVSFFAIKTRDGA